MIVLTDVLLLFVKKKDDTCSILQLGREQRHLHGQDVIGIQIPHARSSAAKDSIHTIRLFFPFTLTAS